MKVYRMPILVGLVLAVLVGWAGLKGYSVVVYYSWPVILGSILLLAVLTGIRRRSTSVYLYAVTILVLLSMAGAFAGHWGRQLHCRSICRACEPILELAQKYRAENGHYPAKLAEMQDFAHAQRSSGLCIGQGTFSIHGVSVDGMNSCDAMIYLSTNFMSCVVPVTRVLDMTITRFYIYGWSSERPSWKYDKLIWILGRKDE